MITLAIAVPNAPSAIIERSDRAVQCASSRAGRPSGAVSDRGDAQRPPDDRQGAAAHLQRAGQVDGDAVGGHRGDDHAIPAALLAPSIDGTAISTMPATPTARPTSTARSGHWRASRPATMAATIAVDAVQHPGDRRRHVLLGEREQLSGKASQMMLSAAIGQTSPGASGRRAAGTIERVRKPMSRRTKVTPRGAMASSPSAMNRNDAPQIVPGTTTNARFSTSVRDMPLTMTRRLN